MNELEGDLSYLSRSTLQYRIKIQKNKELLFIPYKKKKGVEDRKA
jgi:hypothetical protein